MRSRPSTPDATTPMALLENDRSAVRRFAFRRAVVSMLIGFFLLLLTGAGITGAAGFGVLSGALTYVGFTAWGTRSLPATGESRG